MRPTHEREADIRSTLKNAGAMSWRIQAPNALWLEGAARDALALLDAERAKLRRVRRVYWLVRTAVGGDSGELTRREAYLMRAAMRGVGASARVLRVTRFAKERSQ